MRARKRERPNGMQTELRSSLIVKLWSAKFKRARRNYAIRIWSFRCDAIDRSLMTIYGCFEAPCRRNDGNPTADSDANTCKVPISKDERRTSSSALLERSTKLGLYHQIVARFCVVTAIFALRGLWLTRTTVKRDDNKNVLSCPNRV